MNYSEESFEPKPNIPKDIGGAKNDALNPSKLSSLEDGALSGTTDSSKKTIDQEGLQSAEQNNYGSRTGLFKPDNRTSRGSGFKKFIWGSRSRRIMTGGVGVGGSLFGIFFFLLMTAAGPAQLVQLSHVLGGDFSGLKHSSSSRLNRILSHVNNHLGKSTRLDQLGEQYAEPQIAELEAAGISLSSEGASINLDTLRASNLGLSNYSDNELEGWVSEKLGVDSSALTTSGRTLIVNAADYSDPVEFPAALTGLLKDSTVDSLGDGSIISAMGARVLTKYFNVTNLFHPIRASQALPTDKATTVLETQQQAEDVQNDITTPEGEVTAAPALAEEMDSDFGGSSSSLANGLFGASLVCTIRSSVGDIIKFNRAVIVLPAALEAVRLIAIGSQIESGQDITSQQVGGAVNSLVDKNGQSIWDSKALQATSNNPTTGLPDLPSDYAQSFSSDMTESKLHAATDNLLAAITCSGPGKILGVLVGLGAIVAAVPSDGSSLTAYYAEVAIKAAAAGVFVYFLQHQIEHLIETKAVVPALLSGPLGGNLAAYGAREAGNITARSEGGVALSTADANQVTAFEQTQEEKQFQSQSFFARIFNIYDNRTLFGKLADLISPKFSLNLAHFSDFLLNIWHIIPRTLMGIFTPHASAASTTSYNWPFPLYGIPSSILNNPDPTFQDPFQNADVVSNYFTNPANSTIVQTLISRAQSCFGVNLTDNGGGLDAVPISGSNVNPDSQDYQDANCNDTSLLWQRIILFIFDTRTMQSFACYSGDAASCSEVGF